MLSTPYKTQHAPPQHTHRPLVAPLDVLCTWPAGWECWRPVGGQPGCPLARWGCVDSAVGSQAPTFPWHSGTRMVWQHWSTTGRRQRWCSTEVAVYQTHPEWEIQKRSVKAIKSTSWQHWIISEVGNYFFLERLFHQILLNKIYTTEQTPWESIKYWHLYFGALNLHLILTVYKFDTAGTKTSGLLHISIYSKTNQQTGIFISSYFTLQSSTYLR